MNLILLQYITIYATTYIFSNTMYTTYKGRHTQKRGPTIKEGGGGLGVKYRTRKQKKAIVKFKKIIHLRPFSSIKIKPIIS